MNHEPATLLIVDDQPENLAVLAGLLQPHYRVRAARSGVLALRAAATPPRPDLALLDIMMPDMDGYELLARLRADPQLADMPVIFVTALGAQDDEERGFECGAVDYITKPIKRATLLARVRTHLELKQARDRLVQHNAELEQQVADRTAKLDTALHDLRRTYFATLKLVSDIVGRRSTYLGDHAKAVAALAQQTALAMGMDIEAAQQVLVAGLLHDIGKVGFPDSLLGKPVAAMTTDELVTYRAHVSTGADLIGRIDALKEVAEIVYSHHELFNGNGFPQHLSGLSIPIGARIVCAASDYYDLRDGLANRQPWSAKRSGQYLVECAGSRYDPAVIEAMEPIIAKEGLYAIDEIRMDVKFLREGMVLTRDITDRSGLVLLARGSRITRHLVGQLMTAEERDGQRIAAYVDRTSADLREGMATEEPPG
ncbi:MAG: response regulator [Burkholderiales bacterium]